MSVDPYENEEYEQDEYDSAEFDVGIPVSDSTDMDSDYVMSIFSWEEPGLSSSDFPSNDASSNNSNTE
jgi:hypothetical protein